MKVALVLVLLLAVSSTTTAQDFLWNFTIPDRSSASGVIEHEGYVYVAMNENYTGPESGTYYDSYIYKLSLGGAVEDKVAVGTDRDKVGQLAKFGNSLIVHAYPVDSNYASGMKSFALPGLSLEWTASEVKQSERGCPPLVTTTSGSIVTGTSSGQLVVTSAEDGSIQWLNGAKSRSCVILSSDETKIYSTDYDDSRVVAFSMADGLVLDSSVVDIEGRSNAGPAITPDGLTLYQFRSNAGLLRLSDAALSSSAEFVSGGDAADSARYNPIASLDGDILYGGGYIGSSYVAFNISSSSPNTTLLWEREDLEPELPPILVEDGDDVDMVDADPQLPLIIMLTQTLGTGGATTELVWIDAMTGQTLHAFSDFDDDTSSAFGNQLWLNEVGNRLYLAIDGEIRVYSTGSAGTVSPAPTRTPTASPTTAAPIVGPPSSAPSTASAAAATTAFTGTTFVGGLVAGMLAMIGAYYWP